MFYTVYKITNSVNEKIYIGAHKTKDLNDEYMGSGNLIKKAIKKYGIENFKKEYIVIFDNSDAMFEMESLIVNEEFVKREDTYNLKKGGMGGFDHINSVKRVYTHLHINTLNNLKLAHKAFLEKLKDKDFYEKWKSNMSRAMYIRFENNPGTFLGKTHTEETKRKIGEANSEHQSGEGNSQYGTMWIYNLELKENKKIKKDEFSSWEQDGWLKGRKMKF